MDSLRAPINVTLWGGLRKRCPRCGEGRLFRRWYTLDEHCRACRLDFEPAAGNTWAFMYITTALLTGLFIVGMLLTTPPATWAVRTLMLPLVLAVVLGSLSRRKGLAIAIEYLVDRRWSVVEPGAPGRLGGPDGSRSTDG